MSWRIGINHRSRYQYAAPVVASFNEARITPRASHRQTVLRSAVVVEPAASLYTYTDYWQTIVVAFDVTRQHTELSITGTAVVETSMSDYGSEQLEWEDLRSVVLVDRMSEYLRPTAYTAINDELISTARDLVGNASPADAVHIISEWVRSVMVYQAGVTKVSTSALEAWRHGSGVCQDFAHLTVGVLRSLDIPARYVSGYLHPDVDAVVGETARGASHAWIEAWTGSWFGHDPTNGADARERHVTVAHGRDYSDVSPFRGVYQGGVVEDLTVEVDLTRIA